MVILAVDDEKSALEQLCNCIREVNAEAAVYSFSSPGQALAYAEDHPVDIAFIDIGMQGMNGIELAKILQAHYPKINIIFVTGHNEYGMEAFSLHASGYVLKPFSVEDIEAELAELRYPIVEKTPEKEIKIVCFGNFSVYRNGEPIRFKYTKTIELLAYLVDRKGTLCSNGEIMSVLFEDNSKPYYYQKLRADLIQKLPSDVLIQRRGYIGLHIENLECDYYNYLNGKLSYTAAYNGEYMLQYSWAEQTMANLSERQNKNYKK